MGFWFVVLALTALLGLGALVYLVTRVRRFSFLRRLAGSHRALSWIAAAAATGLLFLFAFINLYTVVIVVLHLALFWLLCDFVARIVRRIRKTEPKRYVAGAVALLLSTLYLGAGWIAAHHVFRTAYTIEADCAAPLRIVLLSDSHLGITLDGAGFAREMRRVQEEQPDVVVLTGDFVDDDSSEADMREACRALGDLQTTCGVYFVFGNHDDGYYRYRSFTSAGLRAALTENGVRILEDETALIGDGFYLIGRKDRSVPGRLSAEALTAPLDAEKYTIVLDHQPNDYDAEEAAGADLVLSGHTHGGHLFPAGQIGLLLGANDSIYGLTQRARTTFIVTSGLSGWAIPFKTGTFSEYVVIDLVPKEGATP